MNNSFKIIAFSTLIFLSGCASKKAVVKESLPTAKTEKINKVEKPSRSSSFAFMQKVNDNKVTAQNIVADMTFSAVMGSKDISVPGSLHMRKDKIIRLQMFIPILHSEVARLEFTPDYVLVIDRMHKRYIKEDYNKLDFLRQNGLNFYSLQALFWNQLFLPGTSMVRPQDLQQFKADDKVGGQNVAVRLSQGNMSYLWNTNKLSGLINSAVVAYSSAAHGKSTLTWKYSNFKSVGAKMFPSFEEFSFQTTATKKVQKVTVTLDMDDIKTSDKWDIQTTVSSKYKKIEATDIFGKLFNM